MSVNAVGAPNAIQDLNSEEQSNNPLLIFGILLHHIFPCVTHNDKGHIAALIKLRGVCKLFCGASEIRIGMIVQGLLLKPPKAPSPLTLASSRFILEFYGYDEKRLKEGNDKGLEAMFCLNDTRSKIKNSYGDFIVSKEIMNRSGICQNDDGDSTSKILELAVRFILLTSGEFSDDVAQLHPIVKERHIERFGCSYSVSWMGRNHGKIALDASLAFSSVSDRLQRNVEFVKGYVAKKDVFLSDVPPEFWAIKEVVLGAVSTDGLLLRRASSALQDDEEVVVAAINKNPEAICHASAALKKKLQEPKSCVIA